MASEASPEKLPWLRTSGALVAMAVRLRLDAATVELVEALQRAGVAPLLLKGASVAAWLYRPFGEQRYYQDLDLLVAPIHSERAEETLERLGYARDFDDRAMPPWWREHARAWVRPDGTAVDLHRWLPGIRADPAAAWEILARGADSVEVRSQPVPVLSLPARALHVALHAAQHGAAGPTSLRELERGVEAADERVWRAAASLAAELDAMDAFATGLRLSAAGTDLAERLGLPPSRSVRAALLATSPPPVALGLVQLTETPGLKARAAIILHKVFPPPEFIRHWDPDAARGPTALIRAYARRPFWLLRAIPAGLSAWARARQRARG